MAAPTRELRKSFALALSLFPSLSLPLPPSPSLPLLLLPPSSFLFLPSLLSPCVSPSVFRRQLGSCTPTEVTRTQPLGTRGVDTATGGGVGTGWGGTVHRASTEGSCSQTFLRETRFLAGNSLRPSPSASTSSSFFFFFFFVFFSRLATLRDHPPSVQFLFASRSSFHDRRIERRILPPTLPRRFNGISSQPWKFV